MSDDPKTFLTSGRFDYSLNVAQIRAKQAAIFDRDQGNPYGTGIQKALEEFPREFGDPRIKSGYEKVYKETWDALEKGER
jgi:hypothetical protein